MDMGKLFNQITSIIAYPHTTITEWDVEKAHMIFLVLENYITEIEISPPPIFVSTFHLPQITYTINYLYELQFSSY